MCNNEFMLGLNLSDFTSFTAAFHWVLMHGYWIIFIAMLIEGPIVTAAAGFASALGYFNPFSIFLLSIAGDVVADIIYYAIGYWGRMSVVERFGYRVGLTKERLVRMERLLHEHAWKTLLALKLTPVLPTPGLMLVGATRMPIKKYTIISTVITLPKSLIFMYLGYFFGTQYDKWSAYVNNGGYVIAGVIIGIVLINYLWNKITARLGRNIARL